MKECILVLIIFTAFFLNGTHTLAESSPNILFIIGDDIGVDALEMYGIGSDFPQTPTLENLRSDGLMFTNVWASPVCSATRASLLTGMFGKDNGVNSVPGVLKPLNTTIFEAINQKTQNKYASCVVGKWHVSKTSSTDHPITQGATEFMGVMDAGVEDYYNWAKVEDGTLNECSTYATSYLTDFAINWINKQSKPWFMWLAHLSPHTPFHVPPDSLFSSKTTNTVKQKYRAMIESLDFEIGRLLRSVPDSIREKTIVIFLGDNGTAGNVIQTFPSNRGKTTLYQGGIHVPLIISGEGVTRNNQTEDALINVSDFFSTFMEIATGETYQSTPLQNSYSFKHLLSQNELENEREYNFMEIGQNSTIANNGYTIRDNQYKLLITENEFPQLFDLINDPYETINLLELAPSNDIIQIHTKLSEKLASVYPQITCYDGILNGEESNVDCGGICKICISDTNYTNKKGNYPIVHTGVLSFYDEDGVISTPSTNAFLFGQDAGRIFNFPSYTQYNASIVVDNVTGLMWQKKMEDKMSYQDAQFYADTLTLGGFSDWRIPTIKELYSLIQFTGRVQGEEAITNFIDDEYFDQPLGNTSIGERAIDAQTWSSTHYSGLTMQSDTTIFGVNFVDGRIKGYPKYSKKTKEPNKMYFRMVRGNGTYGQNTFIDNGNGTVSDNATLLMWQKSDNNMALDWMNAIQYCESLELGGYSDWHLPHAKELQSIVDYTRSPYATNSPAIDPIFGTTEISDPEGNSGHYPYFWSTSPHLDGPNPYKNAAYIAFGNALGKMNNTLMDVHGAGAQRSDPKTGDINNYPQYHGPQGDVQMVYNHCRCVRNILHSTHIEQGTKHLKPSIFPNPATELAYIQCSSNNYPLKISIYSSTFQFIQNVELLHNKQGITLSNFPSGIYFIEINNSKSHLTTIKLIKQ